MVEQKLSRTQRFFKAIFPRSWGESMEAESRLWKVRCYNCNFERSVWDMGGIRWKAAGNPKQRATCPNCQKISWHTVYKQEKQ